MVHVRMAQELGLSGGGDPPLVRGRLPGNRWTYATIVGGLLFTAIHVVHTYSMFAFGTIGIVLEGLIPLLFSLGVTVSGPWLHHRGYTRSEQKRIVGWMALVGVISGLLFLWALSHQVLVVDDYFSTVGTDGPYGTSESTSGSMFTISDGYVYDSGGVFPHAEFVAATNFTAGALLGFVLGIYNIRSRRHYRIAQREKEKVAQQRTRLSVLNRVLRHNIRNDATVILGEIRNIEAQVDGELTAYAESAAAKTTRLVTLGEKAREIDNHIGAEIASADDVELRNVVTDVLDSLESNGATVK